MFDVALAQSGASIAYASCADVGHPPENLLDGKPNTFWSTTGLFPQEVVISFKSSSEIDAIQISCCNVRKLLLERSTQTQPNGFEQVETRELGSEQGAQPEDVLQREEISFPAGHPLVAQHIRVVLLAGLDHFAALYRVQCFGHAVSGSGGGQATGPGGSPGYRN